MVYLHTGISLQTYTELRNIYFKMQKKKETVQFNVYVLFSMKCSRFIFPFLSSVQFHFLHFESCSPLLCLFNLSVCVIL